MPGVTPVLLRVCLSRGVKSMMPSVESLSAHAFFASTIPGHGLWKDEVIQKQHIAARGPASHSRNKIAGRYDL